MKSAPLKTGGTAQAPMSDGATAAQRLLERLVAHGIGHFFANPGTDFPSVVEAFAAASRTGAPVPRPVLVTHENVAVSMAHGAALVSGSPQAVMVHTNVGTANSINALTNAARERVPLLLLAGRSPITQQGMDGSRSFLIHWAQEMYDQAGMVRELVKWDYELRYAEQVDDVIDRAVELATAAPQGPIYLSLPREVLASASPPTPSVAPRLGRQDPAHASAAAVDQLAEWLGAAERPLVITSNAGRCPRAFVLLDELADRYGIGVVAPGQRYLAVRTDHPLHLGYDAASVLPHADLVTVLESDVPWIPAGSSAPDGCRIVQIGDDPAFSALPMRRFPADLVIPAAAGAVLEQLAAALARRTDDAERIASRRAWWADRAAARQAALEAERNTARQGQVITPALVADTLSAVLAEDAVVFNEYSLPAQHLARTQPGTYFYLPSCGGLGWGFGAALGAKLAAPDKVVVAALGDGAYVFNNPTSCHWVAHAHDLPVLVLVLNNAAYGAVAWATAEMYGSGDAARDNWRMLSDLEPSPAYEMLPQASGGHGIRVSDPAGLASAITEGLRIVRDEQRHVLINIICR